MSYSSHLYNLYYNQTQSSAEQLGKRKRNEKRCYRCYPFVLWCIIGSLLGGSVLAIVVTLYVSQKSSNPNTVPNTIFASKTITTAPPITTTITFTTTPTTSTTTTTISTTTTMSTTITTTTSTTTTTPGPIISITRAGDPIIGLYNTSAGGPTGASNGKYSVTAEYPPSAIDGLLTTKYLNYGFQGNPYGFLNDSGVNTGFYVTPTISNASVATALLFATANDVSNRDPITVTLEGTNATATGALDQGSSWTLIYSGPTGIDPVTISARSSYVAQQNFSNSIAFRSYRLLVTSQRGAANSVQYAEAQILGYA